jgi:tetratricopeptide (TPR) repeat protein
MRYRDWDYYLPYFAGFNYAFFLKDYANAAIYYKRAGELLGTDLPINLAGRYMYESGRTDMAIAYLREMIRGAGNEAVKNSLQIRLNAFEAVRTIEQAKGPFHRTFHRYPVSVEELIRKGYLKELPVDPYGGMFYIDNQGMVRSTSKFAFGVAKK